MSDTRTGPGWSAAQWDLVNKAVTEAFGKANVAGAFLPCYGPLADSAEYVRDEKVVVGQDGRLKVDDDDTLKLFNVRVLVELSSEQVSEEGLSSALLAFRRAANILGRAEDKIIFNGYPPPAPAQTSPRSSQNLDATVTSAPTSSAGLAEAKNQPSAASQKGQQAVPPTGSDIGELLVQDVVRAIGELEEKSHPGPFVGVLGDRLFEEAHRPRPNSMVLPADRISPMLKGSLFRCGQIEPKTAGIVVSLGGSDIDIVVATPPRAQFLQVTENAKYLFRVYEKFRLRIKDTNAVQFLQIPPF
jgi:uncharacterized linocin/CFP29 family protein